MKIRHITLAVAALIAGTAQAAIPVGQIAIGSGASASKNNLKVGLNALCTNAGGTMTEFTSGGNISTYVCATAALTGNTYGAATPKNFAGTSFAELRYNVNGGAFTSTCLLNLGTSSWAAGASACKTVNPGGAADQYVDPATAGAGTSGSVANAPAGAVVTGGLSDVEPTAWPDSVTAGLDLGNKGTKVKVLAAGFGQVFGAAVSNDLYNAMFKDQALASATCTTDGSGNPTKFTPACTPSITKTQITAIMNSNDLSAAYNNGANFLAPSQLVAGTNLNYGRRVDTSGTQAGAQTYFLGLGCTAAALQVIGQGAPNGTPDGAITVYGISTTGNLRTLLNGTGYTLGLLSAENNQTGQSWKWLRLNGVALFEAGSKPDTSGNFNVTSAFNGTYDYWFSSKIAVNPNIAAAGTFWNAVATQMSGQPLRNLTPGLFNDGSITGSSESSYDKGGQACTPAAAL